MGEIRLAAEGDIPRIGQLLMQVAKVHSDIRPDIFKPGLRKYDDEALRAILKDESRPIFVYDEGEGALGYAFCEMQSFGDANLQKRKSLYIDDLCVDERARGKGIGRQLYQHVCAWAKTQGCYDLTLNVWEGNDGARRFYESMGMRVLKTGMETIL